MPVEFCYIVTDPIKSEWSRLSTRGLKVVVLLGLISFLFPSSMAALVEHCGCPSVPALASSADPHTAMACHSFVRSLLTQESWNTELRWHLTIFPQIFLWQTLNTEMQSQGRIQQIHGWQQASPHRLLLSFPSIWELGKDRGGHYSHKPDPINWFNTALPGHRTSRSITKITKGLQLRFCLRSRATPFQFV